MIQDPTQNQEAETPKRVIAGEIVLSSRHRAGRHHPGSILDHGHRTEEK